MWEFDEVVDDMGRSSSISVLSKDGDTPGDRVMEMNLFERVDRLEKMVSRWEMGFGVLMNAITLGLDDIREIKRELGEFDED